MTRSTFSAIAFVFTSVFAAQAMAADAAPVTRAQIQAELAGSIRAGNMIVDESGQRMNEIFPHNYPAAQVSSVMRAEVRAELEEAIRTGDIAVGESGRKLNEIFPYNYPARQDVAGKSREEIRVELAEAAGNGTLYRHIEA